MRFLHTSRARGAAAGTLAGVALAGCNSDKLVSVSTPDVASPASVQSVAALPTIFASAISEFGVAFGGSNGGVAAGSPPSLPYGAIEGMILYTGLLGDEILLSDTFPTRRETDYRSIQLTNGNNDGIYRQLQIARVAAERAASAYVSLNQPANASQAEVYALAGYTYVFFAEDYCGDVPFSSVNPDGTINPAPGNTTVQILAIASAKFDSAIATATTAGAASQLNLAKIGKARVLVDQGNYAQAATLTSGIPTTYAYALQYSSNTLRQTNGVFSFNRSQRRFSIARNEGTNGLPYRVDAATSGPATYDPRVLVVRGNGSNILGFDNSPLYVAVKYSEQNSPAVLASGVEARLIEAEANLNAGNYAASLATVNTLRSTPSLYACPAGVSLTNFTCPAANAQPMAALTDPGTTAGEVAQLFSERAYWLFLTGHRLGDMRRLSRPASPGLSGYGLGASSVYPVGAYIPQSGVTYGTNTSLPVPFSEAANNPKFSAASCDDNTP